MKCTRHTAACRPHVPSASEIGRHLRGIDLLTGTQAYLILSLRVKSLLSVNR